MSSPRSAASLATTTNMWIKNTDYLAEVSGIARRGAIVALTLATTLLAFACAGTIVLLVLRGPGPPVGPFLGSMVVLFVLPPWFIQMWGAILAIGFIAGIAEQGWWALPEGIGVILAMLGIRRLLRTRQNNATGDDSAPPAPNVADAGTVNSG